MGCFLCNMQEYQLMDEAELAPVKDLVEQILNP